MKLRDWFNRIRYDPTVGRWLPAGIYGGVSGGFAAAWLLWGAPMLVTRMLCVLIKAPLVGLVLLGVTTFGCTFILLTQTLIRGLRQIFRPPMAMYEPVEPIPELELFQWPHPGCGLAFLVPIILMGAVFSVPWFWFGPRQVPVVRLLLSGVVGLPLGLVIARREAKEAVEGPDTPSYYG